MGVGMSKPIQIAVGETFGRWEVIGERFTKGGKTHYPCLCKCGNTGPVASYYLRSGLSQSCGCLQSEIVAESLRKTSYRHGYTSIPEYKTYTSMLYRCDNPKDTHFYLYGGRGITVCSRWRESFEAFYADMGPKPSPEYSIERMESNGNYEPDNCKWATAIEQSNNTSRNFNVTALGETHSISQWEALTGINHETIRARIVKLGWLPESAVTKPV